MKRHCEPYDLINPEEPEFRGRALGELASSLSLVLPSFPGVHAFMISLFEWFLRTLPVSSIFCLLAYCLFSLLPSLVSEYIFFEDREDSKMV